MDADKRVSEYWNSYYSDSDIPKVPSQFCVFVANEFPQIQTVVEVGCGNGRDSLYFSQTGRSVVAVDASTAAVESCRETAARYKTPAQFVAADVMDPDIVETIKARLPSDCTDLIVYARFFLHAIDDEAESKFLADMKRVIDGKDASVCLEFRTERDEALKKTTKTHYRRFVNVAHFLAKSGTAGFACEYLVEGFGMAKYREDDAYVARVILKNA